MMKRERRAALFFAKRAGTMGRARHGERTAPEGTPRACAKIAAGWNRPRGRKKEEKGDFITEYFEKIGHAISEKQNREGLA